MCTFLEGAKTDVFTIKTQTLYVGRSEHSDLRHVLCLNRDGQDYRICRIRDLYANVPLQKVVLRPLQRNIYSPTPNPENPEILKILVQMDKNH